MVDRNEEAINNEIGLEDEEMDEIQGEDGSGDDEGHNIIEMNDDEEDDNDKGRSIEIEVPRISWRPGLMDIIMQKYKYVHTYTNDATKSNDIVKTRNSGSIKWKYHKSRRE